MRPAVFADAAWLRSHLAGCLDRVPASAAERVAGRAAVLVPVVLGPGAPSILLTSRAVGLRHHAGQVSFPGGRVDPADRDCAEAALREAEEEIGLDRTFVRIVGALPAEDTSTGFTIDPVVGIVEAGARVLASPDEVAAILFLPVAALLDPSYPVRETMRVSGRPVWVWPHDTYRIWGATASILKTLADRLRAASS